MAIAPGTASASPTLTFTAVAAGRSHSCALTDTGFVFCWGANDRGQLGTGAFDAGTPNPQLVSDISTATAISAGGDHTCALLADQTVMCWGANNVGQLGDGTTIDRALPVAVDGLTGVSQISSGRAHTCALADQGAGNRVWCWGSNSFGQLGVAQASDLPDVFRNGLFGSDILAINIDTSRSGDVYVNDFAGDGSGTARFFRFDSRGALLRQWTASQAPAMAVSPDPATPYLYTQGTPGQICVDRRSLEDGSDAGNLLCESDFPTLPGTDFYLPALSGIAVDREGFVYVAVAVFHGGPQARVTTSVMKFSPTPGPNHQPIWVRESDLLDGSTGFSFGTDLAAGIDGDGRERLYAGSELLDPASGPAPWAIEEFDLDGNYLRRIQLGSRSGDCPVLPPAGSDVTDLVDLLGLGTDADGNVLGTAHRRTSGELSCVEARDPTGAFAYAFGGVPDGNPGGAPLIADIAGAPGGGIYEIDVAHRVVQKLDEAGQADSNWGTVVFRSSPVMVDALFEGPTYAPVTRVDAGGNHTCVGGTNLATCWGSDGEGELGASAPGHATSFPFKDGAGSSFLLGGSPRGVAAGGFHTCVVDVNGNASCWGDTAPAPFTGPGMFPVVQIDAGAAFTCALMDSGTTFVACRGANDQHQHGDGLAGCGIVATGATCLSDALFGVTSIATGSAHACAVTAGGPSPNPDGVWCWGSDDSGQIGPNWNPATGAADHAIPVSFPTSPGVTVDFDGPTTDHPSPPFVARFSEDVSSVDDGDVVLSDGGATPVPASLICADVDGNDADCSAGPVRSVTLDSQVPLDCTKSYTVSLPGPPATTIFRGPYEIDPATSSSFAPPCPGELFSGPDQSSPDAAIVVPVDGPFVVTFIRDVTNVGFSGVSVTGPGGAELLEAPVCFDASSTRVDCSSGAVRTVDLVPAFQLTCDTPYTVSVGAPIRWGPFEIPGASSIDLVTEPCGSGGPIPFRWGTTT
ncbi:MAG TPA: hypothetical protein VNN79_22800, partial [Actinomycetota bacterium]|nr:hypothetical protein [Actinomycetota bacterium]